MFVIVIALIVIVAAGAEHSTEFVTDMAVADKIEAVQVANFVVELTEYSVMAG